MFLPVILIHRYGWLGFLIFSIPNVIGCAAFGYVVRTPERSKELVEKYKTAISLFAIVTIAFHVFFIAMLSNVFLNETVISISIWLPFGILIGAGVPVLETTALLRKVVDNRVYEKAIDDASDLIRDGYNISTALRRTEVFPSILLQLASTGEDTGELDDLLDRAADYYRKQVDALVDRMTTLIEPLLILLVGAVIALMVVLTYLPVFHLGSALQSGL